MDILKTAIVPTFLLACGIIFLLIRELGRYAEDISSRDRKDSGRDNE